MYYLNIYLRCCHWSCVNLLLNHTRMYCICAWILHMNFYIWKICI